MYAINLTSFGNPEVLVLKETETPTPGPDQLLVRVKATALNRADLLQRRGKYNPPPGESNILGLEIAGEVAAFGSAVTEFKINERVFGLVGSGGYAEYCLLDSQMAMRIPDNLSFEEAAAIPEAFLTADEAVFTLGNLKTHHSILIHAAGSGVGSAAVQLAKQIGAQIFATVGSSEKADAIKNLGAVEVINYKQQDFAKECGNIDVIVDFIGASYFEKNISILKSQGRLVCVGLMGGTKAEINLEKILTKQLQIKGLIMRSRSLPEKREITQRFKEKWLPLFNSGKLHPIIDSVYSWKDVQKAHQRMEDNLNFGKIVLRIEK